MEDIEEVERTEADECRALQGKLIIRAPQVTGHDQCRPGRLIGKVGRSSTGS
ncbi:hypothetical protein [Dyella flava]|uniref:hypothetical protein n=1 Tax=Dyella flava TaxID=1920170 RepID=UPI0036D43032